MWHQVTDMIFNMACEMQVSNEADLDMKYRCNVSDALAQKIASNVSIQLKEYVLYV